MSKVAAAQPRFRGRMDIERAVEESADLVELYETATAIPYAPLFTGGVWDCWPGFVVDALEICRQEAAALKAYLSAEQG